MKIEQYIHFSYNEYDFTIIVGEEGVRLGSCPGLKYFSAEEVTYYSQALMALKEKLDALVTKK